MINGMKTFRGLVCGLAVLCAAFVYAHQADAALTLTAGDNATTTPNVATSITGFQIVGPSASTTPVQLRATHGTLSMTTTTGLTFDGSSSGSTINFSGTVANINAALATLKYSRSGTGTDTLEVSLVNKGEIFFTDNDHLYKFVSGSYSWSSAKTAAEAQTAYGATGYLVTITSQEENDFVSDRLTGDGWIGASDSETEGTWKWVTGPETGTAFWQGTSGGSSISGRYEAWAGGEPNQSGEEDCAETYVSSGTWNDFPCGASLGYVVEFGADGNMPTVVATNISIVTADVPAVTSLSPANGAASVSPTANLVIGFSKSVSAGTGNILIKKVSDDSVVETINVTSETVTGGGSTTITVNPVDSLPEGTQLYVSVPNTAFKDASNNFFTGITDSTTWRFTTSDVTAPIISSLAADAATTTATVAWTTNEAASTRLYYSADASFDSSTSETDTGTRVTSHSVSLSGLISCTEYQYKAVSRDATGNTATSSAASFVTFGCIADTTPVSATSTTVEVGSSATSTLEESGRSLTVETPANFTATSTSVVIQIQSVEATPVFGSIGTPGGSLMTAASIVFDVKAIVNNTTVLDSFDVPVTVSYAYADEDIAGIDESTLTMFHYANGVWSELDDCSVDMATNVITCTAPHFSVFAIFGNPIAAQSSGSRAGQSVKVGCKDKNASNYQHFVSHRQDLCVYDVAAKSTSAAATSQPASSSAAPTTVVTPVPTATYTRDLSVGMSGADVKLLQQFLNQRGYTVSETGPGSAGNETEVFGSQTQVALAQFQAAEGISPAAGYFGPTTRAAVASKSLVMLRATIKNSDADQGIESVITESDVAPTLIVMSYDRDLTGGMSGDDVWHLQEFLIAENVGDAAQALAAIGASGYFGPLTKAALAEWQSANGITPASGYFGPYTRNAILNQ